MPTATSSIKIDLSSENNTEELAVKISKKLKGQIVHNQERIDALMFNLDGTKQKSRLGANAILAISMAVKKLSAIEKKIPLYKNFFVKNVLHQF